jgi:hypothetical protein
MNDLYQQTQDYAAYTPSIQLHSAQRIVKDTVAGRDGSMPAGLTMRDFNYLDPNNRFWSYSCCLATAAHFKNCDKNAVAYANPAKNFIIGDSAGYQIGTGALEEAKPWRRHAKNSEKVMKLWRESEVKGDILKWMELSVSFAPSLDMPLWVRNNKTTNKSPFRNCTAEQLIEISVENLRFFNDNRGRHRDLKLMSVLQGNSIEEEQAWFEAVLPYPLEGWALADHVGQMGGIYRVLRRLLLLRDQKMLGGTFELVHILRLSRIRWMPLLTAAQQAVRKTTNSPTFRITADSSSPYRIAGVTTKYVTTAKLGKNLKNWSMPTHKLPASYGVANWPDPISLHTASNILPVPFDNPMAPLLTLQDLLPNRGAYDIRNIDAFGDEVLINQNVYAYVNSVTRANQAVFGPDPVAPQIIMDAVDVIHELFHAERWETLLEEKRELLAKAAGDKIKADAP